MKKFILLLSTVMCCIGSASKSVKVRPVKSAITANYVILSIGNTQLKVPCDQYSLRSSELGLAELMKFFDQFFLDLNRDGRFLPGPMFMRLKYKHDPTGKQYIHVDPNRPRIHLGSFTDLFSNSRQIPQLTDAEVTDLQQQADKLLKGMLTVNFDAMNEVLTWHAENATKIQQALFTYFLTVVKMSFRHLQAPHLADSTLEPARAICIPAIDKSGVSFATGRIILIKDSEKKGFAQLIHGVHDLFSSNQAEAATKVLGLDSNIKNTKYLVLPYTSTPLNSKQHHWRNACVEILHMRDGVLNQVVVPFRKFFPIQSHQALAAKRSTQDELLLEFTLE